MTPVDLQRVRETIFDLPGQDYLATLNHLLQVAITFEEPFFDTLKRAIIETPPVGPL